MLIEHPASQPRRTWASTADGRAVSSEADRVRMCVVVTIDITLLNLCRGRFEHLQSRGFDITAVCAPTPRADELRARGINVITVPLTRTITPWKDVRALFRLWRLFRRERFDLVEVSTPKAALLGSIAARLARVPCIVHLLRGLAYEGRTGLTRWLVKVAHGVPCRLAHDVIAVSESMGQTAIEDNVCRADKLRVLGRGSSNGVDLDRFRPAGVPTRAEARRRCDIPEDAVVAGFVGRMTRDKGIDELAAAFAEAAKQRPNLYLLIAGEYEEQDPPDKATTESLARHQRVRRTGWVDESASIYPAIDFLVLPTRREGFGNVLIEAAACGLPSIATNIPGCRDAVIADTTALHVPPGDVSSLARAIETLADNSEVRTRMGLAARAFVSNHFAQQRVWSLQEETLRTLAATHARTVQRKLALSVFPAKSTRESAVVPSVSGPGNTVAHKEQKGSARNASAP